MGIPIENGMLENEIAEINENKQKIANRWNKVFEKMKEYELLDLALLLNNQYQDNKDPQFHRLVIPIVIRVWRSLIVRKIASVQPLFGKQDNFYHIQHGNKTSMKKKEVNTQCRKLKTIYSHESFTDLRSCNNIDAETEMVAIMAQEIGLELDRHCLMDMRNCAGTNRTWDFTNALGDTIKEKYESLYIELITTGNIVKNKTDCEPNWLVTSPEIASIFGSFCQGFDCSPSERFTSSLGIQYVGTFGRWRIYKDPLFPTSQILLGYKGNHPYDTGYFYLPYKMLELTPVVLDPNSFCPRQGLSTQAAHRLTNEDYFATISVKNFII